MSIPIFFLFENNFNRNSLNNIEYRYWLCVQISLAYVSVSEVCMRYNMEENLMNDWVLNYMYYDVEEDDCVIDNLGRSCLIITYAYQKKHNTVQARRAFLCTGQHYK